PKHIEKYEVYDSLLILYASLQQRTIFIGIEVNFFETMDIWAMNVRQRSNAIKT
ncbi:hypothetical protein ACJX0J_030472, partial [Zea mays]